MADAQRSAFLIRFGAYEADLQAGELRKHGLKVKLPDQPFQLLSVLLERPGEVVTREELQRRLWESDTFVDFEHGLNKAMNRLRDALRDSADKPRYIETLPKRGYRFIAELEADEARVPRAVLAEAETTVSALVAYKPTLAPKILIAGVVLALTVAVSAALLNRHQPAPQQSFRSSLLPPSDSTFLPRNFALSPDGARLVFSALTADGKTGLWIRALSASRAHRLDNSEGATYPFWSPDSKDIGFFANGKLKTVEVASGVVRVLADAINPSGATWNGDGVIVFAAGIAQPLYRVRASGGQVVPVTRIARERTAQTSSWPYFLPDGKHFLYSVQWTVPGEAAGTGLYAGFLGSDRETLVSPEITGNVAFVSGHLIFAGGGRLLAQPFDAERLRLTGSPVPITDQELDTDTVYLQTGFSVSNAGGLVFESADDFNSHLIWYDSSGKELGQIPQTGYRSPSLSPNGRMIAVACDESHSGRHSICTYDLERAVSTRITDGSYDGFPIWSRDSKEVTYESRDKEIAHIKSVAIDRSRPPRVLLEGGRMFPSGWLEDGRLLFGKVEGGLPRGYIASGRQLTYLWPGAEERLSPDGKWVAQAGVLVRSLAEPDLRIQISNDGTQPRWSHDGRQLFYIAPDKRLMAVAFDPHTGRVGAPRVLFQTRIIGTRIIGTQYDVASDGRFLINSLPSSSSPLTLLTGWAGLLGR